MFKLFSFMIVVLISLIIVSPTFADKQAVDEAAMTAISAKVDAGEITSITAIAEAIEKEVSFSLIVAFCRERGLPLAEIVSVARLVGMSEAVALAKLADAGVNQQELAASGAPGIAGLGYTPTQPGARTITVRPVTSNPGGSAQGGSVSPSTL